MKTMEPYFLLTDVIIINRKKKMERQEINVTTFAEPFAPPMINIVKSERLVLQLTFQSSGDTSKLSTEKVLKRIRRELFYKELK